MSPPQGMESGSPIHVHPTYISTDLITPGRTLPAIRVRTKETGAKLWGQETVFSNTGEELAYNHFKPSHLNKEVHSNVIVTHRHYGSRIFNTATTGQPYVVTSLLLSKCRLNDERMPPPFQSSLIHKHYVGEPYPPELSNSYLSHRSQFQVFPTNGVDLIDAATTSTKQLVKQKLRKSTSSALRDLRIHYYGTTTYNQAYEGTIKPKYRTQNNNTKKKKHAVRFKVEFEICKLCGLKIKKKPLEYTKEAFIKPSVSIEEGKPLPKRLTVQLAKTSKEAAHNTSVKPAPTEEGKLLPKRKAVWPCWPTGGRNIYPQKLSLPKYCLRPSMQVSEEIKFCQCVRKMPVILSTVLNNNGEDTLIIEDNKHNGKEQKEETESNLASGINKEPIINTKPFDRGFKTEAHSRFLKEYDEKIPNLRDAVTEGRRHNFGGFNCHLFRG